MKRFYLLNIITILFLTTFFAYSQNYIVGDNTTYLRSSNGGSTWNAIIPAGISGHLYTVKQVDSDTVFIGGASGLWKSTDSAQSWTKMSGYRFRDLVLMNNGLNIRAAGRNIGGDGREAYLYSNDNAVTWASVNQGLRDYEGLSISAGTGGTPKLFTVQDNGMVIRNDYAATFGGSMFTVYSQANAKYNGVLNNDSIILVLTNSSKCYQSVDSGNTYTVVSLPGHTGTVLNSVKSSPDGKSITIVGTSGYVANSQDGGKTWNKIIVAGGTMTTSLNILEVNYVNDTLVFINGQDEGSSSIYVGIARSTDGGATYTQLKEVDLIGHGNDGRWSFEALHFLNDFTGFVAWNRAATGNDYQLYQTNNGGLTWYRLKYSTKPDLDRIKQILPISADTIVITSSRSNGKIGRMVIVDTVATRSDILNTTGTIRDIYYDVPGISGYAVSSTQGIYRFTSRGLNWIKLTTTNLPVLAHQCITKGFVGTSDMSIYSTSDYLDYQLEYIDSSYFNKPRAVQLVSGSTLYFVGNAGMIIKSTDNGSTITPLTGFGDPKTNYTALSFVTPDTGWVVGDNGTILKTTDGGASWISQTSGTSNNLTAVYAFNSNSIMTVGEGGTILKTTNGGSIWGAIPSGTTENLRAILITDITGEIPVEVSQVKSNISVHVYPNPSIDGIVNINAPVGSAVKVYNILGTQILSIKTTGNPHTIQLPKGLNMVNVNGQTIKLIVK